MENIIIKFLKNLKKPSLILIHPGEFINENDLINCLKKIVSRAGLAVVLITPENLEIL